MRLYYNDSLARAQAEEGDVLAAFEDLRGAEQARLELRRDADSRLSVTRDRGLGFFVSLRRPDGVFGVHMGERFAEHVVGALREYLGASA